MGLLQVEGPQPLEHIRVPTLLLSGSSDDFVRGDQQVLLGRIPDVELVVYDGVGRGPRLARPTSVVADLASFLHGNPDPGSSSIERPPTRT